MQPSAGPLPGGSTGTQTSHANSQPPVGSAYKPAASIDLIHLEGAASDLISSSLAPSSYQTYQSSQSEWLVIHSLPAEELVLILFVAHLSLCLTHSSVRSHLSAVRHMHIVHCFSDPLLGTPWLQLAHKGLKRSKPRVSDSHLPITPYVLRSHSHAGPGTIQARQYYALGHLLSWLLCLLTVGWDDHNFS